MQSVFNVLMPFKCPYIFPLLIIFVFICGPISLGIIARMLLPKSEKTKLAFLTALISVIPMLPFYYQKSPGLAKALIAKGAVINVEMTIFGDMMLGILFAAIFYSCLTMAGIKLVDKIKATYNIKKEKLN